MHRTTSKIHDRVKVSIKAASEPATDNRGSMRRIVAITANSVALKTSVGEFSHFPYFLMAKEQKECVPKPLRGLFELIKLTQP